jgi:hypothetical protein
MLVGYEHLPDRKQIRQIKRAHTMQNMPLGIPFKRGVVQPTLCLKIGWNLIKDQYWVFVGMSTVGLLLGSFVPFGILLGPLMCGIYLTLFQCRRGQKIEFGNLFKGFDYFGESVIATLFHYIPMVIIIIPFYIFSYGGLFVIMASAGGDQPDPAKFMVFFALLMILGLVMALLLIVVSVLFVFTYPLIVERKLSGIDAVKLSVRAGLANFWQLLGLLFLNGLLAFGGLLLCYVGMFLILPVTFGAIVTAYEQVFGLGGGEGTRLPPPPPSFN